MLGATGDNIELVANGLKKSTHMNLEIAIKLLDAIQHQK